MKKILITGIVLILAVFLVTCDVFFPKEDEEVEYTDVVYSEDGSRVTVYLDGVGVPKTEARAMSTDLSRMAYDYLEVIFISGTTIARATWELGQSAGISGVDRGAAGSTGINYAWSAGSTATGPVALMAVGDKNGKTLLGVGRIGGVDGSDSATTPGSLPGTIDATILTGTTYVTFYIESVKTGLLVGTETVGLLPTNNPVGALNNSLSFTPGDIKTNAQRSTLTGSDAQYPLYPLPTSGTVTGEYKFEGAPDTYKAQLLFNRAAAPFGTIERRIPRYQAAGRYMIARGAINTRTRIAIAGTYSQTTMNVVPLEFAISGTGILSFFVDIPVFLLTKADGTNGGAIKYTVWHLRTGFGSELYSLDDGASSGGCVLCGIGVSSLDWLEITWEWLD
jgi:hypothetical protein